MIIQASEFPLPLSCSPPHNPLKLCDNDESDIVLNDKKHQNDFLPDLYSFQNKSFLLAKEFKLFSDKGSLASCHKKNIYCSW